MLGLIVLIIIVGVAAGLLYYCCNWLLLKLGLVRSIVTDPLIDDPVGFGIAFLISGVVAVVLVIIASHIKIFSFDPFKEKFKWIKRKHRFVKVNHTKHLKKAAELKLTYIGFDRMNKIPVSIDDEIRTRHIHILGSTGSGKSVLLFNIFMQDVRTGGGVIFIDAKGDIENLNRVKDIVKQAGREADLLVFTLSRNSNTYNPLLTGNATQLKDKITSTIIWSEPYYQRVCENLLQLLFSSLTCPVTLKQVYELLTDPSGIYRYCATEAGREFVNFASTHKREKTTLTSEIGLLVFTDFYKNLDTTTPEINFFDACRNRKIIYIGIDVQSYHETSKRLGRMITEDLNTTSGLIQTQVAEGERGFVSIIIDEFQAFGTVNFVNALSRGRSSKFMITIAHQSLADLEMVCAGFSRQVIDNTYTKVILQVNDPETIQTIADIIGTKKATEYTKQISFSGEQPDLGSERLVDEYIVHPNEIRNLRVGEAAYKSGNSAGIVQIPYL